MKIRRRTLESNLLAALKVMPVVFINGPRQAGKSTLVQHLRKKVFPAKYVTFDNATQMAAAAMAPAEFLQTEEALIIDEVQLVPDLFRALKIAVDEMRLKEGDTANGRFLLTGSANILALPKLSDALVGRMSVLTLLPFSAAEALGGKGTALDRLLLLDFSHLTQKSVSLIDAINSATFPEISGKGVKEQAVWFEGYLTTLLQRDVRMLAELEKISLLPLLLRILAVRSGHLINDAEIARDVKLNPVTSSQYRTILKWMFLTFDIAPWFRNITKRLMKSSKGFMVDTLLLCHLLEYDLQSLKSKKPYLFGHVVENFVASELLKLIASSHARLQLSHFRTSDGKEVDFVLEKTDGAVMALEVKSASTVNANDFKGIQELAAHLKDDFICGVVLYQGSEVVKFGKNLFAVPFCWLWQ